MINFRNIFNINNSYLLLFITSILFILLALVLKNNKKFIYISSKINLISGFITIAIILKLIINKFGINKIFIEVISNNIFNNLLYIGFTNLLIYITLIIISKTILKK